MVNHMFNHKLPMLCLLKTCKVVTREGGEA